MAAIQTLNSYKEYHDAVVAKQFVDSMRKEGINLSAESTLEVISKNPTEYGLPKGTTREDLNNLLSTLNRVSGSKDYNCTYAQIKESKELFQKRRDLQKDAYSHYKDKTYPAEKKANSAIKQTIAKERAKNFFGFFGRLGITGTIIAVPAILAATLIGGPIAIGIGIAAGVVGLIQHAITRRAVSGRISARNEKITRAKRMLHSDVFGSNRHLAAEKEKLLAVENYLDAVLTDERGYAKAVESAIAKGIAAEPATTKTGPEKVTTEKGVTKGGPENTLLTTIPTMTPEELKYISPADAEKYLLDSNFAIEGMSDEQKRTLLARVRPEFLGEESRKTNGMEKEEIAEFLKENHEYLSADMKAFAQKEYGIEPPQTEDSLTDLFEMTPEEIAKLPPEQVEEFLLVQGIHLDYTDVPEETKQAMFSKLRPEFLSAENRKATGMEKEDVTQFIEANYNYLSDDMKAFAQKEYGVEPPKVEEPLKETPAPEQEAQEVIVDDNGQGYFINPEEYEVEVEKKPRTRKPKTNEKVESVSLFDDDMQPISYGDEAPVATPDGIDNVTPVTADEVQNEIEEADDEVDLSQDIDAVATVSSGTRVNLEEIEAEKAKMREAGELADEPAPVITHEEPENQEPAKGDDELVKKPGESEKE